ncbi:MAG: ABC transporter permease [Neisseria sp.]|nr:ABC transporter permease [Neisseria sp.]
MILHALYKEFRLLRRDLHGLAVLFVMPIAFMLIMSVALSRDAEPHAGAHIVLAAAADNPVNPDFAKQLRSRNIRVDEAALADTGRLKQALQAGAFDMLVINPNPEAAALADDAPLQLLVTPDTDRSWLPAMRGVLQQDYTQIRISSFAAHIENSRSTPANPLQRQIQNNINQTLDDTFADIDAYLGQALFEEVYLSGSGVVQKPTSVQHSVPAWLIFGMFFIMIPLSNVMAMERQTNTLTRLRMAQAPAGMLLASKLLPYFLINQLQFAGMLLLGRYLLPALGIDAFALEGARWPYAALACAISLAALGYGLLVSVCAKTTEQAVVLGGGGIIIMAALGGIMVPAYVMPESMHPATQLSPMAWALQAFHGLLLKRGGFAQVQHEILLLALFGGICLLLAAAVYRKQLKTQVRF